MRRTGSGMILPDPWIPVREVVEAKVAGGLSGTNTGTIVATNNDALLCPVVFPCDAILYALRFAGTNTSGNYDIGFYDGALNRIASKGSTAMSSAIQELTLPNLRVIAGNLYFAAFSFSNSAATIVRYVYVVAGPQRVMGAALQASAHPLPDPFVPASVAAVAGTPMFAFGIR